MSNSKLSDKLCVLTMIFIMISLIVGSLLTEFNYLDAAYLFFLGTCFIRYIYNKIKYRLW